MKKKFGIIGRPIKHSLSPVLHNYWFKKYGLNASYTIIEAEDKDLEDVIKKIREHELTGINVTLPFKQKIINQTDKIINDAELTGSVNTILLDNNKIIGENTDVFGLQAAYLKEIDDCAFKNTLVIEKIMGLMLWTVGLLMLTGGFSSISFWLLETFPSLGSLG